MKIAVTYEEDGNVFQHFGQTEQFKVYDITDGKVSFAQVVSTEGKGHGALAGLLNEFGADTLICGGIGAGAKNAAAAAGLRLYAGVSGNADQAVSKFLSGNLIYDSDSECTHHTEGAEGCEDHDSACSE